MKNSYRIRKGRIFLVLLLVAGGYGYYFVNNNFNVEVTKFKKEFYPIEFEVVEEADFRWNTRLLTNLDDLPYFQKEDGWFKDRFYYVELKTTIRNNSPKKAKFLAYNYIETVQGTV